MLITGFARRPGRYAWRIPHYQRESNVASNNQPKRDEQRHQSRKRTYPTTGAAALAARPARNLSEAGDGRLPSFSRIRYPSSTASRAACVPRCLNSSRAAPTVPLNRVTAHDRLLDGGFRNLSKRTTDRPRGFRNQRPQRTADSYSAGRHDRSENREGAITLRIRAFSCLNQWRLFLPPLHLLLAV
jgi:hypothetical protein